jgi:hypothetical protein
MQVVIAIPEFSPLISYPSPQEVLMRPVSGVPLLVRTVAMAARSRTDEVLIIWPDGAPIELALDAMSSELLQKQTNVRLIRVRSFHPRVVSNWTNIDDHLESRFIWLPWNWVTDKQSLSCLPVATIDSANWRKPAYITLPETNTSDASASSGDRRPEGVAVTSPGTAALAEQFLITHSEKVPSGIHQSLNRRLCQPVVRLLSHTSITPRTITVGGILMSVISAIAFAHGTYWAYTEGALLFFLAGLFDEVNGMLSRIKFADSPFRTGFESYANVISYVLLFGGITLGLHRQYGIG